MVNGCDEGGTGGGVWGGLVQDEFVDIPLISIDPTMGTLRDLVGGDFDDVDLEEGDSDDLKTRPMSPLGEDLG